VVIAEAKFKEVCLVLLCYLVVSKVLDKTYFKDRPITRGRDEVPRHPDDVGVNLNYLPFQ